MSMKQRLVCGTVAALVAGLVVSGCTTHRLLDRGIGSAVDAAGQAVGESIGEAIAREYTPQFTRWYTGYLMEMAFHAGGESVEGVTRDYRPGEYTEWLVTGEDTEEINRMRRAYLGNDADGNQWWQVVYEDSASEDTIIMEALFTPERDRMLRLRTLFPDEDTPQERPVEDQRYQEPRQVTAESLEGAVEAEERISVPAGSFQTRRAAYGSTAEGRRVWWLSDEVPGGVVRYALEQPRSEADAPDDAEGMPLEAYVSELEEYGDDARTRLDTEGISG